MMHLTGLKLAAERRLKRIMLMCTCNLCVYLPWLPNCWPGLCQSKPITTGRLPGGNLLLSRGKHKAGTILDS
jgi:hypothetical protein